MSEAEQSRDTAPEVAGTDDNRGVVPAAREAERADGGTSDEAAGPAAASPEASDTTDAADTPDANEAKDRAAAADLADAAPEKPAPAPAAAARKGGSYGKVPAPTVEGRLLAGRYRLGKVLGRGGMGTVWRAVDETLGRTVAVKELRFPNSIDEEEKRRLITRTLREAKAIARIRNNGAVTVFDVVDEDDRPWIVMELVEGKSLAEAIREDGTLTPRRAAEVGLAILDVLRSAHREGILHRDVKPSNVLIAEDGRVVLTDFGIAQVEGDPSITSTGMLVGAPSYISPERARGHKPGPAADMWSLGGLLYASVEGSPPYDKGSAIATLTAVMTEPVDPPKNAGPELEKVIYGLLAKDPEQRLDNAGARALLDAVLAAPDAAAVAEPSPEATRVVPLPPVPPADAPATSRTEEPAAAERMRGALKSVRDAAAAAAAQQKQQRQQKQQQKQQKPEPVQGGGRPAPVRAPLTDVVPRRTLVIIAVVVALAVLATVLAIVLSGGDKGNAGKGTGSGKGGDKVASSGATTGDAGTGTDRSSGGPGQQGGEKGSGDSGTGGTKQPSGTPSTGGNGAGSSTGGAGAQLPAGYAQVTNDRFHFTMAMPSTFKLTGIAGQNSGGIFSASGGFPRVQVDFNDSPKDDAAAAWAGAVSAVSASSNGYKHFGIKKVAYKGYPTVADWEFERNQGGMRVHVLNRGFKVDADHGYSIMVSCKASEWNGPECRTLRETAFATFSPKD
ncbi:serine/threonine-protein kinase [Streptomyces sp. NPDC048629]|uniref:serine/threonine-protein kinase n=1 Tax=Streptomyces sp. NPDC048629 TaxID=3154824 RepID=UPI003423E2C4